MRIAGELADYQPDYLSSSSYIMLNPNGSVRTYGGKFYLAYESTNIKLFNLEMDNIAHLIIQVDSSKLFHLWNRLIPISVMRYPVTKIGASYREVSRTHVRIASVLLRRGLSPLAVRQVDEENPTILLTEPEDQLWKSNFFVDQDSDARLHVSDLSEKSSGAFTLFTEQWGSLEYKGAVWGRYRDIFLEAVSGGSILNVLAEQTGYSPDVISNVLHGIRQTLVSTVRMGIAMGLKTLSMRIPGIGTYEVDTVYMPKRLRLLGTGKITSRKTGAPGYYATRVKHVMDTSLSREITTDLNEVKADIHEFGRKTIISFKNRRINEHGSGEANTGAVGENEIDWDNPYQIKDPEITRPGFGLVGQCLTADTGEGYIYSEDDERYNDEGEPPDPYDLPASSEVTDPGAEISREIDEHRNHRSLRRDSSRPETLDTQ